MNLRPTKIDWRDRRFSHAKLFGVATSFPDEFHIQSVYAPPDQNRDGRPTACTAYLVTEIAGYQDGFVYSRDYQLMKTLELMGVPPDTDGADLRVAFKVPVAVGLLEADNEPPELFSKSQAWAVNPGNSSWNKSHDEQAAKNKNPAYIPVHPLPGQDWFDAVRSAILGGQKANEVRAVGVGTRWSPDFERPVDGVLLSNPNNLVWGHAYAVTGWKGDTMELLTWQGPNYGTAGYVYMPREVFNRLLKEWGTYAATLQNVPTDTIAELKNQVQTLTEVIAMLTAALQNFYIKTKYGLAH